MSEDDGPSTLDRLRDLTVRVLAVQKAEIEALERQHKRTKTRPKSLLKSGKAEQQKAAHRPRRKR